MSSYFEKKAKQKDREDRPSWRERDARKDGKKSEPAFEAKEQKRDQVVAKKNLDALFAPKKKTKEQLAQWKKAMSMIGSKRDQALSAYIQTHGLPKDWDDLLDLLDANDPDLLQSALASIRKEASEQTPGRKDVGVSKLRVAKISQEDPELIEEMESLISFLES